MVTQHLRKPASVSGGCDHRLGHFRQSGRLESPRAQDPHRENLASIPWSTQHGRSGREGKGGSFVINKTFKCFMLAFI